MSLREDYELVFSSGTAERLFVDPAELHILFPDVSYMEVFELVRFYSLESKAELDLHNSADGTPYEIPVIAQEYVKAAVACALTRLYDFNGMGGGNVGGNNSFRLGDLQVDSNRGNMPSVISRGTAATWCELAAALREEMLRLKPGAGLKSVVRGSRRLNPMPSRFIRTKDYAPTSLWNDEC